MRTSYKIALPALLTAGLLMSPAALSASASAVSSGSAAAMALTLDGGSCEALARRFLCEVSFSGGVAPTSVRWFVNNNHIPSFDNKRFVAIGCQPTFSYAIRAVVSDAAGASVEFRTSAICRSGNP
ncbi:hypothetical protein [Nonomuraea typhae]|uniref:hypothetical protein n=1 Tax=Nonomuraea typhae TaxID=2603600 RepID=UPI0012F99B22|nr:hypothetical protein [Nonomuraea typhae]